MKKRTVKFFAAWIFVGWVCAGFPTAHDRVRFLNALTLDQAATAKEVLSVDGRQYQLDYFQPEPLRKVRCGNGNPCELPPKEKCEP